jgi:hypothetical protein
MEAVLARRLVLETALELQEPELGAEFIEEVEELEGEDYWSVFATEREVREDLRMYVEDKT